MVNHLLLHWWWLVIVNYDDDKNVDDDCQNVDNCSHQGLSLEARVGEGKPRKRSNSLPVPKIEVWKFRPKDWGMNISSQRLRFEHPVPKIEVWISCPKNWGMYMTLSKNWGSHTGVEGAVLISGPFLWNHTVHRRLHETIFQKSGTGTGGSIRNLCNIFSRKCLRGWEAISGAREVWLNLVTH